MGGLFRGGDRYPKWGSRLIAPEALPLAMSAREGSGPKLPLLFWRKCDIQKRDQGITISATAVKPFVPAAGRRTSPSSRFPGSRNLLQKSEIGIALFRTGPGLRFWRESFPPAARRCGPQWSIALLSRLRPVRYTNTVPAQKMSQIGQHLGNIAVAFIGVPGIDQVPPVVRNRYRRMPVLRARPDRRSPS